MQLALDILDELAGTPAQRDHCCALRWLRFFQIGELTLQQRRIHKMSAPLSELICDEVIISAKKHELHFIADTETPAICFFERGTRKDRVLACRKTLLDQLL